MFFFFILGFWNFGIWDIGIYFGIRVKLILGYGIFWTVYFGIWDIAYPPPPPQPSLDVVSMSYDGLTMALRSPRCTREFNTKLNHRVSFLYFWHVKDFGAARDGDADSLKISRWTYDG